ncbi:MAG: hypothetical protein HWN66_03910 [Candidatus Helarchaeota archaeon]|nr:hypothetical protein [Candidatus Helarchaeota archaeon]
MLVELNQISSDYTIGFNIIGRSKTLHKDFTFNNKELAISLILAELFYLRKLIEVYNSIKTYNN